MKLIFSNDQTVDLIINDCSLGSTYQQIYKNLSRVSIPWKSWDNPFYKLSIDHADLIDHLIDHGQKLSINVNRQRCLDLDQTYFNQLHKIYEKNYDGNPIWLDFHEHIHICESDSRKDKKFFCIDYREKSGLLERPMRSDWITATQTKVRAGDLFVKWSELGKTPYHYWKNNEPDDLTRLCELAKPWLKLRPKIYIALEDTDLLENIELETFDSWWKDYHDDWVTYWGLTQWTVENMFGISVFGKTLQVEQLTNCLKSGAIPAKVSLQ